MKYSQIFQVKLKIEVLTFCVHIGLQMENKKQRKIVNMLRIDFIQTLNLYYYLPPHMVNGRLTG